MCGSGEDSSEMSSMSKNSAPGMCSARYSALASRLAVGRCMEPSSTTRPGVSRWEASQSVSTSHFCAVSAMRVSLPVLGPLTRFVVPRRQAAQASPG